MPYHFKDKMILNFSLKKLKKNSFFPKNFQKKNKLDNVKDANIF